VTALIGLGGLGYVIIELGFNRFFLTATLVGAAGSVLLALVADRAFVLLERRLTPWSAARGAAT
jgi:ABC-type proline/glycine betaine transport system permease subunit